MGRVLLLCLNSKIERTNLARIIKLVELRFSGETPLVISKFPACRSLSPLAVCPSSSNAVEILLSSEDLWGEAWTIVLFGDKVYGDKFFSEIVDNRKKPYSFYWEEKTRNMCALSFSDKNLMKKHLVYISEYASKMNEKENDLWSLLYSLQVGGLDET